MILRSEIAAKMFSPASVQWRVEPCLLDYSQALQRMDEWVGAIAKKELAEQVWLVEHPPLYTAGTSAKLSDLLDAKGLPVFQTGRGGQYTYHGPGQRVAYVMLDLGARGGDVRGFVAALETWLITTLANFGILGERREDRIGIWVAHDDVEEKIAAIGIRVRRGVTFHGISINLDPDLARFNGIVPCGITDHGVTSLAALGVQVTMATLDDALRENFERVFSPTQLS